MAVNRFVTPVLFIVLFMSAVFGAQAAGLWSVTGRINLAPGVRLNAADLKGWMTLQQVMDGMGLDKAELYARGKIPADIPTTAALKDLEAIVPGFETSTLRDALATVGTSPAPQAATPAAVPTTIPAAPTPTPHVPAGTPQNAGTPQPGATPPADAIRGNMTLKQVAEQNGVGLDAMLAALKLPANTDVNALLKDLVSAGVLTEVTQVRDVVIALKSK